MICGNCEKTIRTKAYRCCPWCGRALSEVGLKSAVDWKRAFRRSIRWLVVIALAAGIIVAVTFFRNAAAVPLGIQFLDQKVVAFVSANRVAVVLDRLQRFASGPESRFAMAIDDHLVGEEEAKAHLTAATLYYVLSGSRKILSDPDLLSKLSGVDLDRGLTLAVLDRKDSFPLVIFAPKKGEARKVRFALRTLLAADHQYDLVDHRSVTIPQGTIEWYAAKDPEGRSEREGLYFCFQDGLCLVTEEADQLKRALETAASKDQGFWNSGEGESIRFDTRYRWPPDPGALLAYGNLNLLAEEEKDFPPISRVFFHLLLTDESLRIQGVCHLDETEDPVWRQLFQADPGEFTFGDKIPHNALAFLSVCLGEAPDIWEASREELLAKGKNEDFDSFLNLLQKFDTAGEAWLRDRVLPNLGKSICLVQTGMQQSAGVRSDPAPELVLIIEVRDPSISSEHLNQMRRYYFLREHMDRDRSLLVEALTRFNFDSVLKNNLEALKATLKQSRDGGADPEPGESGEPTYEVFLEKNLLSRVPFRYRPARGAELIEGGYLQDRQCLVDPWGNEYAWKLPADAESPEELRLEIQGEGAPDFPYEEEDSFAMGTAPGALHGSFLTPLREGLRLRPCYVILENYLVMAAHRRWLQDVLDVFKNQVPSFQARNSGPLLLSGNGPTNALGFVDFERQMEALRREEEFGKIWRLWHPLLRTVTEGVLSVKNREDRRKLDFEGIFWIQKQ